MRLLTNDNSTESVKRLSRTACVEFGYIRSIYEKLTPIVDVSNQLNYYEQQIYMDENHFKGISCNASVETFKECQLVEKIKESSALYEIEIECLCKSNLTLTRLLFLSLNPKCVKITATGHLGCHGRLARSLVVLELVHANAHVQTRNQALQSMSQ